MTSHTITMTSGAVTAGRQAFADAFTALPDGDYTVTIAPVGDPAAAISEIVEWYRELDGLEHNDPALGWILMEKAGALVTLCAQLSDQAREAKDLAAAEANALEARRVVLMHELQEEADSTGAKFVATVAERKIDYMVKDFTEKANLSARIAAALKTTLDSANRVLSVISNNHIPMLRKGHGG